MKKQNGFLKIVFGIMVLAVAILYMYPIIMIVLNSFKVETAISTNTVFQVPTKATFNGFNNFIAAITKQ